MVRRRFERMAGPLGRLPLAAKGVLVVIIPVMALLCAIAIFYLFQQRANDARAWVDHTFRVSAAIGDARVLLSTAESGVRGYLLSKNPSELQAYSTARNELPKVLDSLRRLVSDNPSQAERAAQVQRLSAQSLDSLEAYRRETAAHGDAAALGQMDADRGLMGQLRAELEAMQDEERRLLQQRSDHERHTEARLQAVLFVGGAGGLVGALLGALLFTTSIVRRVHRLEEDARKVAAGIPVKAETGGSDEITQLGNTLEQTSHLLVKQEAELRQAHAELENRVRQRTAELSATNEELRKANDVRHALIQSSPLAIWAMDPDGRVMFWNPAAERIFGWTEAEAIGRPLRIVPEEQREEYNLWLERFQRGEALAGVERTRLRRDGTRIDVSIWTAPLRDAEGKISGTIAIDSDITQRRTLEEQFRQSQKLEAIGRLAGGVAHDFNNLLTVIMGYIEMLMLEAEDRPDLIEYAHEVQYAADRASALTAQLLAFSRRQISQPRVLNLNEVVTHSMKLLRRIIGEDVEIATHLDPSLGKIHADPIHIDQVIMNLVVNARDAMVLGGRLAIETANVMLDEQYAGRHIGVKAGPYAMLAISDTGSGMSDQTKSRLFEPFFTTKEAGKGTGLGLSIVYGIVKQNGGEILVYSELGLGTTFKIYLPLSEMPEELTVAQSHAHEMRGSETVLVCEDESGIRKLVIAMLTKNGYRVLEADGPQAAIAMLRERSETIHLLVTDIVMPHINGFELAKTARELRPRICVLYMSGYTDTQVTGTWVLEPNTPFLHKPFTATTLAKAVRDALESPAVAG